MADEIHALTWSLAIELLDANFHFRIPGKSDGEKSSYRAAPNGPELHVWLEGNQVCIELPVAVASLKDVCRLGASSSEKTYRYSVSTIEQLLECIQALTTVSKNEITPVAAKALRESKKTMNVKLPLNSILYGPPGTGKTYSVVRKRSTVPCCQPAYSAVIGRRGSSSSIRL